MLHCALPSVGELWMSLKIKACWEFIEELLTVLVYLYLWPLQMRAGRIKEKGTAVKCKVCKVKARHRKAETAFVFFNFPSKSGLQKLNPTKPQTRAEKHDVWSDLSLQGWYHTFLLLPLWYCNPRIMLRLSPSSVKDFQRREEKIKTKISQAFSHLLFPESGAGNERRKEMPQGEGGGRIEGWGVAEEQYPHLKHLSLVHLKKIWTGFFQNLPEERLYLG